ncbi:germinal-center associated nuclear protein [Sphaeramia orbicularis]|uniref:germinal-center associated nuclear protein n=1 Tax=Sphaeramia orbicularis TaxID=375764 RepID=UPI00117E752E|nr:germinal-center associated nuclear protein [Sphaeramia orbicularis]
MNPPNPFGNPQIGAFHTPSNAVKTGPFPSFGQQSSSNQPQNVGFFQSGTFGQSSALNQPSSHGSSMFGQTAALGQPTAQSSTLQPTLSQPPAFEHSSLGLSNPGFGGNATPAFGQTGRLNQTLVFGQSSAFSQAPGFGQQAPGFGKQPPGFGQSSGLGNTLMSSGSSSALGQTQPLSFGQSFGQHSSTTVTTGTFGAAQNITQSKGFGSSEFSFKPANEALFKPIFSASPESANRQTTSMSSSPFGSTASQASSGSLATTGTSTTGFSLLSGAKSNLVGFSFSQPAAAPSVSAQNNPLSTGSSSTSSSSPMFTFSQPAAAPSSSSNNVTTTQLTSPSSFNFSAKTLQPQANPFFGGSGFGRPSPFGDTKSKVDMTTDEKASSPDDTGTTDISVNFSKSTKRKGFTPAPVPGQEEPATEGDDQEEADRDAPRQPPKRPLMRSRGPPGGLFSRALSSLRKDVTNPVRGDGQRETQQQASEWEETKDVKGEENVQAQEAQLTGATGTVQTTAGDILESTEESDAAKTSDLKRKPRSPARRAVRRESTESLGGISPGDCTTLYCKNVPVPLNKRDTLLKHFAKFGKVSKIYCKPAKKLAIVHFEDNASAAKAKKNGKMLHKHELLLFWQRKKQSPGDKTNRPSLRQEAAEEQRQEDTETKVVSSPLKRPPLRAEAVTSTVPFSHSSPVKKLPVAKSLHFDSEPQKENSTDNQSSERLVSFSFLNLIGQVAETAEDKYRLLEQRDKILRQGRPKRSDLNLSKVFVGTCPDMCPEKERYMRETRNQLSVFEVIPNTEMVDHAAAIKEYSRSSADQEEPLPHDLRPLPVLSMTMDYLVTQIMDQGHDNFRDWYDFVWNRTRGIRKDITQQHLCCPNTVMLIEKCTRFHVHCAHHLCEEHMSSFDAKINNENMTKCLQSLKEMYQDLATRHVYCPREAEFRQYSVLLKLNDGDILREVQQFRDEVRNSPEVTFAVQAFAAVNSNNFVRFFKLVKAASYLASCLLHRYFNQVRTKALKTLNMAHTVGPRSTLFPVDDIVRMLMFRCAAEAADFIQQYGLNVSDGMVELNRTAYQEPDLPLSLKKSEVILAKKTVLIGEVVNGGSLPNPPQHQPVRSFDSQNKYCGETSLTEIPQSQFKAVSAKVEAKVPPSADILTTAQDIPAVFTLPPAVLGPTPAAPDQTREPSEMPLSSSQPEEGPQLFLPVSQPQPVRTPPPKPKVEYSNEDILAELNGVIEEVVEEAVWEVAEGGASYTTVALLESSAEVESLLSEVLGQMLQEISSTEIQLEEERVAEEKRKLEEARRRQEHEAFLTQFSFSLCSEIIHQVLDETIHETAASEIQQAVNEKAEHVAKCTEQVCTSLVEETLDADIAVLVEEILDVELQRILKYIKRWRDVVAVRRQLKRQMRAFPAAPCCVDPRFKLKALAPSAPEHPSLAELAHGRVNLGNAGTLAVSSTRLLKMRQEAVHKMRVHYYYQKLLDETVWTPLDLPTLVMKNTPDPPERIFWKALLLLPSDHDSRDNLTDRILSDWLETKLAGGQGSDVDERTPDGTLQTLYVTNSVQDDGESIHKVHISVKASRGPLNEDSLSKMEDCGDLQGTGALILLLPTLSVLTQGEQDLPLLSALLQLKQLQQASSWCSPVPLVILVPGQNSDTEDTQKLDEVLMLHTLVKEGLISQYTFLFIPETTSDLQASKQLNQALCWLLARAPPHFPLSCQTLVQLIETSLSTEFTCRLYSHRQERAAAGLPPQHPAPVIQLFNAVLSYVADTVSSQELSRLSWPPYEFCLPHTRDFVPHLGWNSVQHHAWLRKAILSLQLPQWEDFCPTGSWSELCSSIFRFATQIQVSPCSQPLLMSQLENLLERARKRRTTGSKLTLGNWTDRDENMSPAFDQIPWDDILVICIDYKLKDWQIPEPPVCEDAVTEDGAILVYFNSKALTGFQPPEEWTQAVRQTHREKYQENKGVSAAACASPSSLSLRQRLFQSPEGPVKAPEASLVISHTPTAQELLAHNVLQSLQKEKAESKRIMEQFECWRDGDPLDYLYTPLFIPSSTLLSTPTTMLRPPTAKTKDTVPEEELSESADWPPSPTESMAQRLKNLQRQITARQEEELAFRLQLNGLLNIVDD